MSKKNSDTWYNSIHVCIKQKMVLMNGAKKARNVQSVTNNICNLGGPKKGGLVTMQGKNANLYTVITNQGPYCCVETNLGCIAGLAYLKAKNLMTMNPQCSGGVPHRMYRGCRSGSGSDYVSGTGSVSGPSAGPSAGLGTDPILLRIASNTSDNLWTLNSTDTVALGSIFTVAQNVAFLIPTGTTLTINGTMIIRGIVDVIGTLTINGTIQIYGTLNVAGTFNMNGSMENFSNDSLNNYGVSMIGGASHNYGTIRNYQNMEIKGNIRNHSKSKFINQGMVSVDQDAELANDDTDSLINQGANIYAHGPNNVKGASTNLLGIVVGALQSNTGSTAIESIADQTAAGTWTLRNTFTIVSTTLTIPSGQTLIVPVGLTLLNNYSIVNNGTIINRGTLETFTETVYARHPVAGVINNNNGKIENYGTIIICRYLVNLQQYPLINWFVSRGDVIGGTIENKTTGRIIIRPAGKINQCSRFINDGTIDNSSMINCGLNSIFENNGTITNSVNTTGVVANNPTVTSPHGYVYYLGELVLYSINHRIEGTGGINRGTITNNQGCRIELEKSRLTNMGSVINDGLFQMNFGTFTNNIRSILRNNGTITGVGNNNTLRISLRSNFTHGTINGLVPTHF